MDHVECPFVYIANFKIKVTVESSFFETLNISLMTDLIQIE